LFNGIFLATPGQAPSFRAYCMFIFSRACTRYDRVVRRRPAGSESRREPRTQVFFYILLPFLLPRLFSSAVIAFLSSSNYTPRRLRSSPTRRDTVLPARVAQGRRRPRSREWRSSSSRYSGPGGRDRLRIPSNAPNCAARRRGAIAPASRGLNSPARAGFQSAEDNGAEQPAKALRRRDRSCRLERRTRTISRPGTPRMAKARPSSSTNRPKISRNMAARNVCGTPLGTRVLPALDVLRSAPFGCC